MYTRTSYAELSAGGLARRSYAEVLREPVFLWQIDEQMEHYAEAIRGGLPRRLWEFF